MSLPTKVSTINFMFTENIKYGKATKIENKSINFFYFAGWRWVFALTFNNRTGEAEAAESLCI